MNENPKGQSGANQRAATQPSTQSVGVWDRTPDELRAFYRAHLVAFARMMPVIDAVSFLAGALSYAEDAECMHDVRCAYGWLETADAQLDSISPGRDLDFRDDTQA